MILILRIQCLCIYIIVTLYVLSTNAYTIPIKPTNAPEDLTSRHTKSLRGTHYKKSTKHKVLLSNRSDLSALKDAKPISTQELSTANTIKVFDLEYSLDSLQPSSIFSQNATYLFNGQYTHLPSSSVYEKDYDDELILASYNNKQEIQSVVIQDRARRQTAELKSVGDNKLATIDNNELVNNTMKFGNEKNTGSPGLRNMFKHVLAAVPVESNHRSMYGACTEYDVIDLAIAYDTSYCNALGSRENAEVEIASIVSLVSKMYQQNELCMKVEISYLEGYCEIENDPYSGLLSQNLDSSSLLFEFRKYWNANRQNVHRTVAHLFTATEMSDQYIGRGYKASICMKASAYGVNQITWSPSINAKAGLVAHELGHNIGAEHIDIHSISSCGNREGRTIMSSVVNDGKQGFHTTSVESMRKVVDSQTCMRRETR